MECYLESDFLNISGGLFSFGSIYYELFSKLKSNTDSLHFQKHEDFEAFEVPTSLLNGRRVGNQIRPMISELMKKADILEVIIHR